MNLEQLVNSKNEAAILSFFLFAPNRSFSPIEISKRLQIPYLKTIYILNYFSEQGHLKNFSKKNKKYYLLNPKHKLLPEIQSFLLKQGRKYEDELFFAIKRLGDLTGAYLSGIFVGLPSLPVDLLLVGKINLGKLEKFLLDAEKMMGQEINYAIMTTEEFLVRKNTFDRFIKDIFDYKHLVIVEKNNEKKKTK